MNAWPEWKREFKFNEETEKQEIDSKLCERNKTKERLYAYYMYMTLIKT